MAYVSDFLTQSSTTGGAAVVLTLPPHVTDDIIVVCVSADGGGTLSVTWGGNSAATGQVGATQVSGLLLSGAVFYARATGTAATAQVNMGTADAIHVHMVILKDVDTTTHLDASNATVAATAPNGIASVSNFNYISDTPIYIRVRKSSTGATRYIAASTTGTIISSGFSATITLTVDTNA